MTRALYVLAACGVVCAIAVVSCNPPRAAIEAPMAESASTARGDAGATEDDQAHTDAGRESVTRLAPGQVWEGMYECAQGMTHGELRVTKTTNVGAVEVVFEFAHEETNVQGSYRMVGLARGTHVWLRGTEWIVQPPGYAMVTLVGEIEGDIYTGQVMGPACNKFSVQLEKSRPRRREGSAP